MLKKSNKLYLGPSLSTQTLQPLRIIPNQSQIKQLFQSPYRQIFELEYLFNSPHMTTNSSFAELVKMLQHFNEETTGFERGLSIPQMAGIQHNRIKITCMQFIYREMLSMVVMQQRELRESDYAGKLKKWYNNLGNKHSFLQGVSFARQKHQEEDSQLENIIRRSYASNVYDEIQDYFRKKLNYSDNLRGQQNCSIFRTKHNLDKTDTVSLPYIDTLLYKREEKLLREVRERKDQKNYLNSIKMNKNKNREISLTHMNNKYQIRGKATLTQHKQVIPNTKSSLESTDYFVQKMRGLKRSNNSLFKDMDTSVRFDWHKSSKTCEGEENNRLSLININGINLIHSKYQ